MRETKAAEDCGVRDSLQLLPHEGAVPGGRRSTSAGFATLKTEIGTTIWATSEQARADVFAFIQRYNRNHRHSTLDHLTCEEADLRYRHELPLAA